MSSELEESLAVLSRALDQTEGVLAAIPVGRLSDPTPCRDWDVARLIAHVVQGPRNFVTMAKGGEPDWAATPPLPDDCASAFRSAADELLQMWRDAGESASPQAVDWQTAEFAVHTWDLARATGQSGELDPQVAQRGLDFMSAALTPENRGAAFGPAAAVPDGASVYDRLAAFAGREQN
jgi:uncharacterized protein (TIGR03086 family)